MFIFVRLEKLHLNQYEFTIKGYMEDIEYVGSDSQ